MKHRLLISLALSSAALLVGANFAVAADNKAEAPQAAASQAKANAKSKGAATKSAVNAKGKPAAAAKLVDINSATKEELKKLPGIGDAEADKIVAGRPYGTKGWLVSHKVLADDKYPAIRELIVAKQPFNDARKNAAVVAPKK